MPAWQADLMADRLIARQGSDGVQPVGVVAFTAMADGTAEDYELLERYERAHAAGLADRVLTIRDGGLEPMPPES